MNTSTFTPQILTLASSFILFWLILFDRSHECLNFAQGQKTDFRVKMSTHTTYLLRFHVFFLSHGVVRAISFYYCQVVTNMTNSDFTEALRKEIFDNRTFTNYTYYGDFYSSVNSGGTSHMSVISPDGDAVAATTTINL